MSLLLATISGSAHGRDRYLIEPPAMLSWPAITPAYLTVRCLQRQRFDSGIRLCSSPSAGRFALYYLLGHFRIAATTPISVLTQ